MDDKEEGRTEDIRWRGVKRKVATVNGVPGYKSQLLLLLLLLAPLPVALESEWSWLPIQHGGVRNGIGAAARIIDTSQAGSTGARGLEESDWLGRAQDAAPTRGASSRDGGEISRRGERFTPTKSLTTPRPEARPSTRSSDRVAPRRSRIVQPIAHDCTGAAEQFHPGDKPLAATKSDGRAMAVRAMGLGQHTSRDERQKTSDETVRRYLDKAASRQPYELHVFIALTAT
ncbi:hypothetical protein G7Y89_g716 [Cudoniella acicularis]|uniref:Uncharacterized protein n=1 Tax=Cudoniella acicularis TaxID=354080 RepID=A0A8H4RWN6_9HELO|nr:hypothetical protein G7Y89_g716 [Cudoniella acicularis]